MSIRMGSRMSSRIARQVESLRSGSTVPNLLQHLYRGSKVLVWGVSSASNLLEPS